MGLSALDEALDEASDKASDEAAGDIIFDVSRDKASMSSQPPAYSCSPHLPASLLRPAACSSTSPPRPACPFSRSALLRRHHAYQCRFNLST